VGVSVDVDTRLLWLGVVAAPAAWTVQLVIGSELEELSCSPQPATGEIWGTSNVTWIALVSLVAGLVAAAGVAAALHSYRAVRRSPESGRGAGWVGLLASASLLTSTVLLAGVVAGAALLISLDACHGALG
jgi:hypothetical protein